MDFVMGLPLTASKKNSIWVIVDRLTKSTHFVPIHDSWTVDRLAQLYVKEIVRKHGVPRDIISDRDSRFQARFWKALQKKLSAPNYNLVVPITQKQMVKPKG